MTYLSSPARGEVARESAPAGRVSAFLGTSPSTAPCGQPLPPHFVGADFGSLLAIAPRNEEADTTRFIAL